jgi:hypothetical protein
MDEDPEAEQEEDEFRSPITKIQLDVKGSRDKRYQGEFVFHVPTIGDQIRIGRLKSEYLPSGGVADPNAALLVEQCCYLAVTIKKAPDWWDPFAMYDAVPISALYAEGTAYEATFHGASPEQGAHPGAAEGEEDTGGSNDTGEANVGRKVRRPAQRRETLLANASGSD